MQNLLNNCVLVIIEVIELNSTPVLDYITLGVKTFDKSDIEYGQQAVEAYKEDKNQLPETTYNIKCIIKFTDLDDYYSYLKNNLGEYFFG